jgi:RHS repeat-associated protein
VSGIRYVPFSDPESSPSTGDRMMGFAGLEYDAGTGLYLAVHRVMLSIVGRWMSQDPIGFAARDVNLYRYVRNTPNEYTDGLGLEPISWWDWYLKETSILNQGVAVTLLDWDWLDFMPTRLGNTTWDSVWAYNFAEETYPVSDLRKKFSEQQLVDANNCRYMKNNAARHIYWQAILTMHYGRRTAIIYANVHETLAVPSGGLIDGLVDEINNEIGRRLGESIARLPGYNSLSWNDIDALLRSIIRDKIAFAQCGNSGDPVIDITDPRVNY